MKIRLLRKIQKTILEEPRRIRMAPWVTSLIHLSESERPPCGTAACIGGWAVAIAQELRGKKLEQQVDFTFPPKAKEELGLSTVQADRLFFTNQWPNSFAKKINLKRPGTKAYAQVVSERVDHFIATKGAE